MRRIFTLAAGFGLVISAVIAGCSSSVGGAPPPYDGSGQNDPSPPPDASRRDVMVEEGSDDSCLSSSPIDTSNQPFETPTPAVVGACTDADFMAMEANVPTVTTFSDLAAGVSAACKACAFTQAADPTWGPIVLGTSSGDIFNSGACLALVSGSDDCGKAYAALDACTSTACMDCGGEDTCLTAAAKGACAEQANAVPVACGASLDAYLAQCENAGKGGCATCNGTGGDIQYQFEEYVVQQCVHDPREADAAAPDAG